MSTDCTSTSSSTSSSNVSSTTTISSKLDEAIALETLKMTSGALGAGKWTWAVAGSILFIVSIDGAKKMFVKMTDSIINYLCNMSSQDWANVGYTALAPVRFVGRGVMLPYRLLLNRKHQNACKNVDNESTVDVYHQSFSLQIPDNVWKAIWNLPNVCYTHMIQKVQQQLSSSLQEEVWTDIMIHTDDFVLVIKSTLQHTFVISSAVSGATKKLIATKIISLHDESGLKESPEIVKQVLSTPEQRFQSIIRFTRCAKDQNDKWYAAMIKSVYRIAIYRPDSKSFKAYPSRDLSFVDCNNNSCFNSPLIAQHFLAYILHSIYSHNLQFSLNINIHLIIQMVLVEQFIGDKNKYIRFKLVGTDVSNNFYNLFHQFSLTKQITKYWEHLIEKTDVATPYNDPKVNHVGIQYFYDMYIAYVIFVILVCGSNYELYKQYCQKEQICLINMNCVLPSYCLVTPDTKKEYLKLYAEFRSLLTELFSLFSSEDLVKFKIWFKHHTGMLKEEEETISSNELHCSLTYTGNKKRSKSEQVSLVTSYFEEQQLKAASILDEDYKVKINYIQVKVDVKMEKIKNPAYTEFQARAKEFGLLSQPSDSAHPPVHQPLFQSESTTQAKVQMLSLSPSEYIDKQVRISTIEVQELNQSFKKFNTLYLQEQDQSRLLTCLNNFKHHKKLLQELGYPHKLGVLLYGQPGTGKSATILAIASYLQKDLYYVDLRTVKCNSDLKKIIDHILTVNLQGGVIVFEDIDANTDIVHSRVEETENLHSTINRFNSFKMEATTTSICGESDSALTLDFLLNILQGTLSRDDMVFVITTNYVEKLDAALIRDGRIDVKIEMKMCNTFQLQQMWKTIFKREIHFDIMNKFQEYKFTPASILSRCAQFLTTINMNETDYQQIDYIILQPYLNE